MNSIKKNGYKQDEICCIGDGKYDAPAVKHAGIGICPGSAVQEVKDTADIVLKGAGGERCIYELYQMLNGGLK